MMGRIDCCPEEIVESLRLWHEAGIQPGSFLTAVLQNDFIMAIAQADAQNLQKIHHIAAYVYNEVPSECWGNAATVTAWRDAHRRLPPYRHDAGE